MVLEKIKKYRCKGTTTCNKRCRKVTRGNTFCKLHEHQNESCSICLNIIRDKTTLECGHRFCKNCIFRWMCTSNEHLICKGTKCPLCRSLINDDNIQFDAENYGIEHKIFIVIQRHNYDMSNLTLDEIIYLSVHNIRQGYYITENEWNIIKTNINPLIIDKMVFRVSSCLLRVRNEEEWNFFKSFNKLFLFD